MRAPCHTANGARTGVQLSGSSRAVGVGRLTPINLWYLLSVLVCLVSLDIIISSGKYIPFMSWLDYFGRVQVSIWRSFVHPVLYPLSCLPLLVRCVRWIVTSTFFLAWVNRVCTINVQQFYRVNEQSFYLSVLTRSIWPPAFLTVLSLSRFG
jgi:hypothetical protein